MNMESKFKPGDKVRVVKYGHLMWINKTGYEEESRQYALIGAEMEYLLMYGRKPTQEELDAVKGQTTPNQIVQEDELSWTCDISPELVGKEGTIKGSYALLYGASKESDYHSYSVVGIEGKSAWFDEDQLELIT